MFNPLKQLGDLHQLQKQAKDIQKQLADEEITIEEGGIKVVVNGNQRIKEITFAKADVSPEEIVKVVNQALEKMQKLAAQKMMGAMKWQ